MLASKMKSLMTRFAKDDSGLALTEYLVLLGLLTGILIGAVILFGNTLNAEWRGWAAWVGSTLNPPGTDLGVTTPPTN